MAFRSLAAITAPFRSHTPAAQPGTLANVAASGEQPGTINSVEAMAYRGINTVQGKTVNIKAVQHFAVAGQPVLEGDVIELPELDANDLVRRNLAVVATNADLKAAQKGGQ